MAIPVKAHSHPETFSGSARTLEKHDLEKLSKIAGDPKNKDGVRNIPSAYNFLRTLPQARADVEVLFWLGKATEINQNLGSSMANTYIRTVTRNGLAYDGKAHDHATLQRASDLIGKNVIWDVLQRRHLPTIKEIIKYDVGVALNECGVTIGGWGGSFNYWNFVYNNSQTVGAGVQGSKRELLKFLDVNSDAVIAVAQRHIECTPQNAKALHDSVPSWAQDVLKK